MRGMEIRDRADLYKSYFSDCKAVEPVKSLLHKGVPVDKLDALEAIRALNTELSDLYMVEIPVITCWVRDSNYVPETREIYLTEPDLKMTFSTISDIIYRILSGDMSGEGSLQREIRR